jgi:hypothetical protein
VSGNTALTDPPLPPASRAATVRDSDPLIDVPCADQLIGST